MISVVPKPQRIRLLSKKQYLYKPADIQRYIEEGHGKEGYRLLIDNDGIKIFCETDEGAFRAETTLKQLYVEKKLPNIEIWDFPRFQYRGYMLDSVRHFFDVETIKKQIKAMALLKLNYFHWHLTDDQGWRIESKKYPLLTQTGSKRAQTAGDGKPVSGFYTREQIKEVVEFAKQNFIEVIPEIDIPGHMTAAIASYPSLSCDGQDVKVSEGFGIHKNVACAGKDSVIRMLGDIIEEAAELFPCKYFHLGGDEAPGDKWENCPDCKARMQKEGLKNRDELQAYMMNELVKRLEAKGKTVINWNDGMKSENIGGSIIMQHWKESKDCIAASAREAAKGRPIIYSPFFGYYLDYPYGMTSLKKTYTYKIGFKGAGDGALLGLEAPLWTEYIEGEEALEKNTYPRLCAVAERAWSNVKEANYDEFCQRLRRFNKFLDAIGVKYVTIEDANPAFIKGKLDTLRFFINALKTVRRAKKQTNRRD